MSELISVTEAAASKIGTLLVEEKKDEAGLRVFVQGGGCSGFQYGLMLEDGAGDAEVDRVFQSNGVTLFVDPISIRYLNGAEVDFVDIDLKSYNMSVPVLEQKLRHAEASGKLPDIVVPVHFAGQSCEMEKIYLLSQRYGFKIVEDAFHAIGGSYRTK